MKKSVVKRQKLLYIFLLGLTAFNAINSNRDDNQDRNVQSDNKKYTFSRIIKDGVGIATIIYLLHSVFYGPTINLGKDFEIEKPENIRETFKTIIGNDLATFFYTY